MSSPVAVGLDDPWAVVVAAAGSTGNRRFVNRSGINLDIDTGATESIWSHDGLWTPQAAALAPTVSSSSAADTAAGTGARTVLVMGLDANFTEQQEIVTLNGTTAVATVNQYLRLLNLVVLTAGSGTTQAGDIYVGTGVVTAGVPATVYLKAPIGYNASQSSFYTVPAGWTAYLVYITGSAIASATNQRTLFALRERAPASNVWMRGGSVVATAQAFSLNITFPRRFPEKTDIDAIADTTDTNVVATAVLRYLLIRNGT